MMVKTSLAELVSDIFLALHSSVNPRLADSIDPLVNLIL